jgi:hypothetical protein
METVHLLVIYGTLSTGLVALFSWEWRPQCCVVLYWSWMWQFLLLQNPA